MLIGIIIFAWMMYAQSSRLREMKEAQRQQEKVPPGTTQPPPPDQSRPTPPPTEPRAPAPIHTDTPWRDHIVTAADDLKYKLVWSTRGAALRRARLTDYAQTLDSKVGVLLIEDVQAAPLAKWDFDAYNTAEKACPNNIPGGSAIAVTHWSPDRGVNQSGALACGPDISPARATFDNPDTVTTVQLTFNLRAALADETVLLSCGEPEGKRGAIDITIDSDGRIGVHFHAKSEATAFKGLSEYLAAGKKIKPAAWHTLRVAIPRKGGLTLRLDDNYLGEIIVPEEMPALKLGLLQIGRSLWDQAAGPLTATVDDLIVWGVAHRPGTFAIRDPNGEHPFDTADYNLTRGEDGVLTFTALFADGLQVKKEFIPRPGTNELGVNITFTNTAKDRDIFARYNIVAAERIKPTGASSLLLYGPVGYRLDSGKIGIDLGQPSSGASWWPFGNKVKMPYTRQSNAEAKIIWAGAENRYFAAILMAEDSPGVKADDLIFSANMALLENVDELRTSRGSARRQNNITVSIMPQPAKLAPGQSVTHSYTYFIGPKIQKLLKQYSDKGLPGVLDYGMFGAVSKMLLAILNFFHGIIPNYGVSIILLTIVVKAGLHPFTRKSQIAMHRMQKLQPLIRQLQEKYKGDRQKLGQAQMELMRKHKANPMSGCWPIFFQMPVFLGLFRMLQYSIHLRHAKFIWWIKDLSQPDTITQIAGFPLNILPILMVASWLYQSMSQPSSADPQQAQTQKMMKFMPVIFGVLLYGMASGLTLYWLTSTSLGILEQRWIKSKIRKMEAEGAFAAEDVEVEQAQAKKQKGRRGRARKK